jgi:hypothetical protein
VPARDLAVTDRRERRRRRWPLTTVPGSRYLTLRPEAGLGKHLHPGAFVTFPRFGRFAGQFGANLNAGMFRAIGPASCGRAGASVIAFARSYFCLGDTGVTPSRGALLCGQGVLLLEEHLLPAPIRFALLALLPDELADLGDACLLVHVDPLDAVLAAEAPNVLREALGVGPGEVVRHGDHDFLGRNRYRDLFSDPVFVLRVVNTPVKFALT